MKIDISQTIDEQNREIVDSKFFYTSTIKTGFNYILLQFYHNQKIYILFHRRR